MRLEWTTNKLTVYRQPGDKNFYGGNRDAKGESAFLHALKLKLIELGYDVIKKRMWKDGHMVDEMQQYIRSRNKKCPGGFAICSPHFAIRGLDEVWNSGDPVVLQVFRNIFIEDTETARV